MLEGTVERLTFHNAENLYTVLKVKPLGQEDAVTAVGRFVDPRPGHRYSMRGRWVEHKEYGRQFACEQYEELLPKSVHGIERFLCSGLIKGIGEATARRLVETFGEDTLRIIEEEPHRLTEVPLLPATKIRALVEGLAEHRQIKNVVSHLAGYDLSPGLILRVYRHYGAGCVRIIQENPYQLCEDVWGVGFKTADRVAQKLGLPGSDPARVQAGLLHVLKEAQDNGHLYLPRTLLVEKAAAALELEADTVEEGIVSLLESHRLVEDETCVYTAGMYNLECSIVSHVQRLLKLPGLTGPGEADTRQVQAFLQVTLAPLQVEALQRSFAGGLFIMTGGPGTGKTTTVRSILEWCRRQALTVRLAAPTGRAAKRMTEATGEHAVTLHRLLEWSPQGNGFQKGAHDPLTLDVLIVDEASMLDVFLFHAVLAALPENGHLVLVGDADQLPSVGPGQVLADLIGSGVVPTVHLQQIFRQGAGSLIVENSHRINQGLMPEAPREGVSDFYFVRESDTEAVASRILEYVAERIPQRKQYDPIADVQVLAPMYRGACGIDRLNELLQARLNPDGVKVDGVPFRLGDKVMQLRNNYEKGAYNGDMGLVVSIDAEAREFIVRFWGADDDVLEVRYEFHEAGELTLAYACSVHKSQGSEFPVVLMPVVTQHFVMLQRNLLYTAVSRARKLLILVGQPRALAIAVKNDEVVKRYSSLSRRLVEATRN